MEKLVTIVTKYGRFNVDRQKLADNINFSARISKLQGRRPGEPTNLTETASDPISGELFSTLNTILIAYSK